MSKVTMLRIQVEVMEVTTTLRAGEGTKVLLSYRDTPFGYSGISIPDGDLLIEIDPTQTDGFPLGRMFYLDVVPVEGIIK